MTTPYTPGPGYRFTETPPPVKKKSKLPLIIGIIVGLVLLLCGGSVVVALLNGSPAKTGPVQMHSADPGPTRSSARPTTAPTSTEPAAATTAPTTPPVVVGAAAGVGVEDGIYHVGEDIPVGTYRTDYAVTDGCYWMKAKDAEGQGILSNDLPTGGRPQVKLAKGQWFTTSDCGTWTKK